MSDKSTIETLSLVFEKVIDTDSRQWLETKIKEIIEDRSTKKLYLTYTLLSSKIEGNALDYSEFQSNEIIDYLNHKQANILEISRIYLLANVLRVERSFFQDKVSNLIQIADTQELETFLKYLVLLPSPQDFISTAVEALRTNIATVFEAISMDNPYPSLFFNQQQWNQMYLKAAFMQLNLSKIIGIDKRANKDLTRIISDYAHERWAASRNIDAMFWRPVVNFLDEDLLGDMKRLFDSDSVIENKAAALICSNSNNIEATRLLEGYPELKKQIDNKTISWDNLKN